MTKEQNPNMEWREIKCCTPIRKALFQTARDKSYEISRKAKGKTC